MTTGNFRNKNRGYQQLRVWEDAMDFFVITHKVFRNMPFEFKLENGLLKLVESLERKQMTGDWIDHLVLKESNMAYGGSE